MTEEQKVEFDRLEEEATNGGGGEAATVADADNSEDLDRLKRQARTLAWKIESMRDVPPALERLVKIIQQHDGKTVDLPSDRQRLGTIVQLNMDKTAPEILEVIVIFLSGIVILLQNICTLLPCVK